MPILRLLRFPALFTTFPDVLAGYAIIRQGEIQAWELTWLLIASGLLYLSGMVFNDVFDIEQDRAERPNRPIPSGAVSLSLARRIGSGLMLGGIAASLLVSVPAVVVAVLLALAILAYDAGGKRTFVGPVLMGLCRSLNLLLGAACITDWQEWTAHPPLMVAGLMGLYVVGITVFAKSEARESSRVPLFAGLILTLLALLGWGVVAAIWATGPVIQIVVVMLLLIAVQILRRAMPAIRTGQPALVQQTVRVLLLTIPMLEALVIVAYGGSAALPLAIAAALMMIPGQILSKFIPMT